jgi:hypothetical protein
MESIRITANKMESIRITIHKLDFFDNITKVGRIVIYEFTTPFTGSKHGLASRSPPSQAIASNASSKIHFIRPTW